MQGVITKTQSGFYTVEAESGIYVCQLRGKLKRGKPMGDIAAIGDQVDISIINKETGVIEEVQPRRSSFRATVHPPADRADGPAGRRSWPFPSPG